MEPPECDAAQRWSVASVRREACTGKWAPWAVRTKGVRAGTGAGSHDADRLARRMKICLLGFHNLPVLAPEYAQHTVGGESVQQTLLARALARRGHEVSMVVADHGQPDGAQWESIRVFKAYDLDAGLPVLRFIHPRWTGLWSALARADADLYYTSCAGMHVGP